MTSALSRRYVIFGLVALLALGAAGATAQHFYFVIRGKVRAQIAVTEADVAALRRQDEALRQQLEAQRERLTELNDKLMDLQSRLTAANLPDRAPNVPPTMYQDLDGPGSYNAVAERQLVSCGQVPRTRLAVLVVAGQSNAGNHGLEPYWPRAGVYNFNLFDGRCYVARDPLLGATGRGGNLFTVLADQLIAAGLYDNVLIAPIAVGGTPIAQWAPGERWNMRLLAVLKQLQAAQFRITHVLWQQGEADVTGDPNIYKATFRAIAVSIRRSGVQAPIYVAQSTRCRSAIENDPLRAGIRQAQAEVVDPAQGIFAGPDTDRVRNSDRDWFNCHFSAAGMRHAAALWLEALKASP